MSLLTRHFARLQRCLPQMMKCSTAIQNQQNEPIISSTGYLENQNWYIPPREAWLENLDTVEEKKLGLIILHPNIFGATPRTDIIHDNVRWQRLYRYVSYAHSKSRAECPGGGRKPWPQKGTGRARHGSIRSPLFLHGGRAHGPRSHKTHFYMLPFYTRVLGLTSTLSVKLAQDDLHIVQNLEIPTDESSYIEELIEKRNWGPSVLFVDKNDFIPENIAVATNEIKHVNIMPVYGLNVYSMLKHTTLVLTEAAVRDIEEKILYHLSRTDTKKILAKYRVSQN